MKDAQKLSDKIAIMHNSHLTIVKNSKELLATGFKIIFDGEFVRVVIEYLSTLPKFELILKEKQKNRVMVLFRCEYPYFEILKTVRLSTEDFRLYHLSLDEIMSLCYYKK